MATVEATQRLDMTMFGPGVSASCRQCGKPAHAWLTTEQGRITACRDHVRLALDHFARVHGIKR